MSPAPRRVAALFGPESEQLLEFGQPHRPAQKIALRLLASGGREPGQLFRRLDAFRRAGHAEIAGEPQDRAHDGGRIRGDAEFLHELTVDLP